jgi:hypothetical protein
MAYCTSCGIQYNEGIRFCPNCGVALAPQQIKPDYVSPPQSAPFQPTAYNNNQMENVSVAARLFMVSGRLPGLNQGFSFYDTPSGEKVNSRLLATYLIASTIEHLKNRKSLEYRPDEISAIMGKVPVLVLKRLNLDGTGFEKLMLEKLDAEKNLIDLVKDIVGARYIIPEERVLWLIRNEFPAVEFMREEKVKVAFLSRTELRWIPEKVKPLVDGWLAELAPVWDVTLKLPWLAIAARDCNFAFSSMKAEPDRNAR